MKAIENSRHAAGANRLAARGIALALILFGAQCAFAWNDCGHMAVAALAYPQLTETAKQRVAELLQRNPDYAQWVNGIEPAEQPRIAFMRAATWPDAIKNDPAYSNEMESKTGAIVGYADKQQHRHWHYINTPFTPDHTSSHPAATPNLQTQIAALRRALQNSDGTADKKSYSLVWLLHLVGDAHQPLHAVSRYTHAFPNGDQGGNAIVVCEKTCNLDLHAYWDRALGTTRKPKTIQRMIARYPAAESRRAALADEAAWLRESAEIARREVYVAPIGVDAGSATLTKAYKANARAIAQQQAVVAGARLAHLLNQALSR